jgi:hypothetical protein
VFGRDTEECGVVGLVEGVGSAVVYMILEHFTTR